MINYIKFEVKQYHFKILTKIILIFFFCLGLLIYKDYGVSWDEYFQRSGGIVNLKFIYEYFNIPKILVSLAKNSIYVPVSFSS